MPKIRMKKLRRLAALVAFCCLTLTPFLPASRAQRQEAGERRQAGAVKPAAPSGGAKTAASSGTQAVPRGVAASVIASGQGTAGTGVASVHEASGPVYQKVPPPVPQPSRAQDRKKVNPVVVAPAGRAEKILDTPLDPPTSAFAPGSLPRPNMVNTLQRASANAQDVRESRRPDGTSVAPTDFFYATVRDIPSGTSPGRGFIGEPSVANMGSTVFYTGNSYAARSFDGGATFSYVSPYTTFPETNGGFCCDQVVNYAPAQNMLTWALQYHRDINTGTLRLARAVGSASVMNNLWLYSDFKPQDFGFAPGAWMDFPGMTLSSNFLYLSSNVFNREKVYIGSVVWRIRLTDLASGGPFSYSFFKRTDDASFAPRLTEGATTTMYWATHIDTSVVRIFRWDDASGSIFWDDVAHNPFDYLGEDGVAVSPDGTNWAGRFDSRILGAWVAKGVIGLMWGAKQDATFPFPYTVVTRFNQSTRALFSQSAIWNPQYAWQMPTASVNAAGDVAGLLAFGGGPFYPNAAVWISDDIQNGFSPVAVYAAAESNNGPYRDGWGDYHTVRPHKDYPNSWVAATYYMQNGGDDFNTVPRYLWFGRERDLVCSFSISPVSQSFASGGGTGSVTATASTGGCARTAVSNASWLTVTSGAVGVGSGAVGYSVAVNTSGLPRTGTMTIAGRTFTVTQAASTASAVQVSAATFVTNEVARKVLVSVTRTGNTSAAASVDYATADGTASRLKDYTQTLGTLVFAPGETSKAVTVFVTNDTFLEPAETFTFTLSNVAGTTLGSPASAVVTIASDDATTGANPVGDAAFSADFFVRQHYVDFLNREADASGLGFWTGEITQCGANIACRDERRINVSAAFFLSIEFQNTGYLVYRAYKAAYGDATSPGVAGTVPVIRLNEFLPDTQRIGSGVVVNQGAWQAQLEANKNAYMLEFVQRPRFLAAFPVSLTPAQFVDRLRLNTGSALTQAERDQLVLALAANNTVAGRAFVLRSVAEDATLQVNENNRAFVLMQYYGYLRRNPNDSPEPTLNFAGWKFWLDKLNQFGGNYVSAEMVKAFITSAEYRQRFGP